MKKFYYVIQTKTVTLKGKVVSKVTSLLGYNMNEMDKDKEFYCFNAGDGYRASMKQYDDNGAEIVISNGYGMHTTRFKSDNEAYKALIIKPKEFNEALSVINKYGFDVVEKGVAGKKVKVVSYQQAVEM